MLVKSNLLSLKFNIKTIMILNQNKNNISTITVPIIIFIILATIGFFLREVRIKEYPRITTTTSLNNVIETINYTSKNGAYIMLKDSTKVLMDWAYNYDYSPYDIIDFVQIGDSIVKQAGSDTIILHRCREEYLFILWKMQNKPD